MKKFFKGIVIITLSIITLFVLYLLSGGGSLYKFYNYKNWQTVSVEKCGEFKMPEEWDYFFEDNRIYVVDEQGNPVMIETHCCENEIKKMEQNKYCTELSDIERIQCENIPNSVCWGKASMKIDEENCERYFISFDPGGSEETKDIDLIVWNSSIKERIVEKIAWSFGAELETIENNYSYDDWQTISIEDVGTLKIPKEWNYSCEDNRVYVGDNQGNPLIVESCWEEEDDEYFPNCTGVKYYFEEGRNIDDAQWGTVLIETDETDYERYIIILYNFWGLKKEVVELIILDSSINETMVDQITLSYEPE